MNREDIRLFVIGYGFRDRHINECLWNAARKYGLKLYVLSFEPPEKLKKRLTGEPDYPIMWDSNKDGEEIWNSIAGYFPYKLKDVFPVDQSKTHVCSNIFKIFS